MTCAVIFLSSAFVSAAGPSAATKERFAKDLLAIGDTNLDGRIQRDELERWLFEDPQRLLGRIVAGWGAVQGISAATSDPERFRESFATAALIPAFNAVDAGDVGLSADELEALESYEARSPFGQVFAFALPEPAPIEAVSFENPDWTTKQERTLIDGLDQWLGLRRSFLDSSEIGKPASIAYSNYGEADATLKPGKARERFEVRGALVVEPEFLRKLFEPSKEVRLSVQPVLLFEADYSSDVSDARSKLTHRLGLTSVLSTPGSWLSAHNVSFTADYVANATYSEATLGATAQWTPNLAKLGVGRAIGTGPAQLRWRPYVNLTYAHVVAAGSNADLLAKSDALNLGLKLAVELRIAFLKLVGEVEQAFLLLDGGRGRTLFSFGARVSLDAKDRVSVQLTKTWGQRAPAFKVEDLLSVGLGLKL